MGDNKGVLAPYRPDLAGKRFHPFRTIFLLVLSSAAGCAIPFLQTEMMSLLALPIVLGIAIILWLLPEGGEIPNIQLLCLLCFWIAANCLWPNYISLDIPGLPWINPPRVIFFILLLSTLVAFSRSSKMRSKVSEAIHSVPVVYVSFWLFWGTTIITILLSPTILFSLTRWVSNQIFWTFLFALSSWIALRPGVIERVIRLLVWTALAISVEAIYEYQIRMVPWANSIPSWLTIDDASLVKAILTGSTRSGTEIYRARGTFGHALILAEYLSIVYPFIIHLALSSRRSIERSGVIVALIIVLLAMFLSGSRSGMIGFFISVLIYGGLAIIRYWRRHSQSLIGVAATVALPFVVVSFLLLSIFWPRLHNMTFGGSEHASSSEARVIQWETGLPKIYSNPIGHGPGMGSAILGYRSPAGVGTIDSYYLSLLLEYGAVGCIAFLTMFCGQIFCGIKAYFRANEDEETLSGPISVALLNFLIIKLVSSGEFCVPLAFVLLGFASAIVYRQKSSEHTVVAAPLRGVDQTARAGRC